MYSIHIVHYADVYQLDLYIMTSYTYTSLELDPDFCCLEEEKYAQCRTVWIYTLVRSIH